MYFSEYEEGRGCKKFKKSDQLMAAAPTMFGCGDTIERQIEMDTMRVVGNNHINR